MNITVAKKSMEIQSKRILMEILNEAMFIRVMFIEINVFMFINRSEYINVVIDISSSNIDIYIM